MAAWIRDASTLLHQGVDSGELSRQERTTWSRKLHRRLDDLKVLDARVVELQGALLESV